MLELILGQIFGFFIIGSALHGIYTIVHFQGRRLTNKPFTKKALHGLWGVCLVFFSLSYISSLSRTVQGGWSKSVSQGVIEVQAAQPPTDCLFEDLRKKDQCADKTFVQNLILGQWKNVRTSSDCHRVVR